MKKDIYIEILKYCRDHPNFKLEDLLNNFALYKKSIKNEFSYNSNDFVKNNDGLGDDAEYVLSFEGRSKLLQFEKLSQNKKNSNIATIIALASFLISTSLLVISLLGTLNVNIINNEVPIKKQYDKEIAKIIDEVQLLNNKLDSISNSNNIIKNELVKENEKQHITKKYNQ